MDTKYLKQFIFSGIFSGKENNLTDFYNYVEKQVILENGIKIVYGETYDKFGLTIDSLKYYFILHIFKELLGKNVYCDLIIGDTASLRNEMKPEQEVRISHQIKNNIATINDLCAKYKLNMNPILMSELCVTDSYKDRLEKVTSFYHNNKLVKKLFRQTVLANRIKQEEASDFLYSREEVALITDYDIKIGPPREKYYDKVASIYKDKNIGSFRGLYVNPTYPIGFNFDYFISNPEIEEYGLTPYKAGSNQLQDHRIILRDHSEKLIKDLIERSYYSNDPDIPNPLLDLFIIGDLARRVTNRNYDFQKYSSTSFNKNDILPLLHRYIFSIL